MITIILSTIVTILLLLIVTYYTIISQKDTIKIYTESLILNNLNNENIHNAIDNYVTEENINELLDKYLTDENISEAIDKYVTEEKVNDIALKYIGCRVNDYFCLGLKALNANVDQDFCKREEAAGNKCFNKCVIGTALNSDETLRSFCMDDHGTGYTYSGNKSQAHCLLGQGIASCKKRNDDLEKKLFKHCVMRHLVEDKNTADMYCRNDHGPEWASLELTGAGCFPGLVKALCVKSA